MDSGLLFDIGSAQTSPTSLYADNMDAIRITENRFFCEHIKHIEVDCHFIREEYECDIINLPHVST